MIVYYNYVHIYIYRRTPRILLFYDYIFISIGLYRPTTFIVTSISSRLL